MKPSTLNLMLAVSLIVVLAIAALAHVDNARPNFEIHFGYDMAYSPAYGAYAPNTNFADGRTLQAPPAGTIPRGGELPLYFAPSGEDALRAGEVLTSPYSPASDEGKQAARRGGAEYTLFCTACHGDGGLGDGPVVKRGFPPPPSLLTGKSAQMKDGQLFHILTYGQGSMPNFAAQLSPARRWDVIGYIRKLQRKAATNDRSLELPAAAQEKEPGNSVQSGDAPVQREDTKQTETDSEP